MKVEFESVEDLAANLVKKGYSEEDAEKIAKSMFGQDTEKNKEDNTALSKAVADSTMTFQELSKSLEDALADDRITQNDASRAESAFRSKDKKTLNDILEKMKSKLE